MKNKLTEEQKNEIVQKYQSGLSCKKLGEEFNCQTSNISLILKNRGITVKSSINKLNNTYKFNENYFDTIDTEHKAYWLGFLYADGCVKSTKRKEHLAFVLQECDKYILEQFLIDIESNHKITLRPKKKSTHQNHYAIAIYNKYLCESLTKLGCHPNKSFTLKFPTPDQVPNHLINHFIRGLWDGDGSISIAKRKFVLVSTLVGTVNICSNIQNILHNLSIKSSILTDKRCKEETKYLTIGGSIQVQKFAKWLYQDATIYLKRKYNKIIEYQEYAKEHNLKVIELS